MSSRLLADNWPRLDDAERDDLMAGIHSSSRRLERLLGDLLTIARLESSTLAIDLQARDVADVIRPVLQRLRVAHAGARIEDDLAPGLVARVDADRLGQIVDNLVANAVLHGEGPVRVVVRATDDHVEVVVCDSGSGVPPELHDRLFERFATGGTGNGLGLYIVRELANALGGGVIYRAEDNEFVVRLPRTGPS
jgi:signal transduction histidine kinase